MSRRTVLGLVLAGGAGLAGAQQTGAFSSVMGDRGFDVQTAEDKDALVGIKTNNVSVESGEEATLFTITNQFNSELTIDSVYLDAPAPNGLNIDGLSGTNMPLSPGGKEDIVGTITCDSTVENEQVSVIINASTDSESVELTRSSGEIQCQPAGGQCLTEADLDIEKESETISCIDITINGNKESSVSLDDVTVSGDVDIIINGGGNAEISIEIEETNIEGDLIIKINGNASVSTSIDDTHINGNLTIESNGNGEIGIELEDNTVDGNKSVDGEEDSD